MQNIAQASCKRSTGIRGYIITICTVLLYNIKYIFPSAYIYHSWQSCMNPTHGILSSPTIRKHVPFSLNVLEFSLIYLGFILLRFYLQYIIKNGSRWRITLRCHLSFCSKLQIEYYYRSILMFNSLKFTLKHVWYQLYGTLDK